MRRTNVHRLAAALVLIIVKVAVQACSTSNSDSSTDAGPSSPPYVTVTVDAAICNVAASSFDNSCGPTIGGCVLVPAGGNVCDPCGDHAEGALFCSLVPLSAASAATYLAQLNPAIAALRAANPEGSPGDACLSGSCPADFRAVCVDGKCALDSSGDSGGDDDDDAGRDAGDSGFDSGH